LANRDRVIAIFEFIDELRPEARRVVSQLRDLGCDVSLLSGDHALAVGQVASAVGIDDARYGQSPEDKLAYLEALTASGKTVAMVGDGMNDAPVMAAAQVSFAMGRAPDMTQMTADVVLVNDDLDDVLDVFALSARTRRIIRQNFAWAIGYNLLAIPAAVVGIVPPWLAAIGKSTSSAIVSINALRLLRQSGKTGSEPTEPKMPELQALPGTG